VIHFYLPVDQRSPVQIHMLPDSVVVRPGEELDATVLACYLGGKIEGAEHGISVHQFPSGHSNLTYLLQCGGHEYVLRRPPFGPVPPKAHDMAREYRVLEAVHPRFPEAPCPYWLCEDPAIIGAVFFLMERRKGIVLHDVLPAEVLAEPAHGRRISEAVVDCLARLHSVELRDFGNPEGFVERQVRGWAGRWHRAKTAEMPEMDRVIGWLESNIPPSSRPTLVHNDFKLDNVMFASDGIDRVVAVLDWEMATMGDPLADVGLALCYWAHAPRVAGCGVAPITTRAGWYTRDEFIERYASKTGRDMTHIIYHEVLGVFKLAVIIQQIYARFHRGQTADERFAEFAQGAAGLLRLAASIIEEPR
jgi:aminoglycoside phosphotransferase (APT) family kinase protein